MRRSLYQPARWWDRNFPFVDLRTQCAAVAFVQTIQISAPCDITLTKDANSLHSAPYRPLKGIAMAQPNYSFEKRQKELAKKKKKEEKLKEKALAKLHPKPEGEPGQSAGANEDGVAP